MSYKPQVLNVVDGGSGVTSNTAYALLAGGTTSTGPIQSLAGIGTSGQVLTSNGAGNLPTFQATTPNLWTRTTSAAGNYTTVSSDQYVGKTGITGGGDTITLIAAGSFTNRLLIIKDESGTAGTNNITIDGNGAETIDGAGTYTINTNYGSVTLYSDGTVWYIV